MNAALPASALLQPTPTQKPSGKLKNMRVLVEQFQMEMEIRRSGVVRHVDTGITAIDQKFPMIFFNGEFIYIAGRPGDGKTALLMQIGDNIASTGKTVLFFSVEMTENAVLERLVAHRARIDMLKFRKANLDQYEEARLKKAMNELPESQMHVTDGIKDVNLIVAEVIESHEQGFNIACILIDYIQKMCDGSKKFNSRHEEVESISAKLLELAKRLNVPVIVASQLNRNIGERTNKRPNMSDMRDSGGIEQDAHAILGIYRDEIYNPQTPNRGIAEIIGLKYRNGAPNTVARTRYVGEFFSFEDEHSNRPTNSDAYARQSNGDDGGWIKNGR